MNRPPSSLNLLLSRHTKRREFIKLIAGSVSAWPLAALAQQPVMPVIGFLHGGSAAQFTKLVVAFRQGLKETGYVEGQNVAIEYRWAEGHFDELPALAAELVRRRVAVLAAMGGDPAAVAAKAATRTIPIIFETGTDPVKLGLVSSLNRPDGQVTGVSLLSASLLMKQLELLRELVPAADTIGFLVNPNNPTTEVRTKEILEAARSLGVQLFVIPASNEGELESAFATLQNRTRALLIPADAFFFGQRDRVVGLAARYALPASYPFREWVASGGLMSYGPSLSDDYRLAGIYCGRVLGGEKPADLPIQQSTKVEFVINLKTAKVLGLSVPNTLIGRADEVIE